MGDGKVARKTAVTDGDGLVDLAQVPRTYSSARAAEVDGCGGVGPLAAVHTPVAGSGKDRQTVGKGVHSSGKAVRGHVVVHAVQEVHGHGVARVAAGLTEGPVRERAQRT